MQLSEVVLEQAAPPARASEFRLVRYFTLTSLAAFVIVAAVLGTVFRAISVASLLRSQEEANVNVTRIFSNQLWAADFGPFVRAMSGRAPAELKASPEIPRLHAKVLALMRGSNTFKVKVYALDGMTLYSTELAQIGEDKRGNAGVAAALQGRITSELVHRNSFSALEQQVLDRDLIQSYIPAYEEGRLAGVFEVYSDVTPWLAEIRRNRWLLVGAVVGLLAALYAALFFIVNVAQGIIRRQSQARYRDFLAAAAHELRTPVTSIYGFADLLRTRRFDRETAKDVVATLHQQAEHLVRLLNELLDLSRIEARAAQAFDLERQPLGPILMAAATEARPPGDTRATALRVAPGLPELMLDRVKMRQALANVLSNAYKFSPPDAPISVDAFRDGNRVGIRVSDRGIGMSQGELAHLFERFWRADGAREIPGSGLGMALTREIVRFHGGSVEVRSAPGEGTQVTFWLPC
jgi:signal transduction histidine kinase